MKSLADCCLYAFVDTAYLRGRSPADVARQLCDGGADLIQLRAKDRTADEIRRMAEELLPIAQDAGVGLVINDYPSIAHEVGAPLCHLGQEDFFAAGHEHVGALAGPGAALQIGLSSHSPAQAQRAIAAGAAYVAVGPVYATRTKPQAQAVTLDYVRWAAANVAIPWFAIGGIHLGNLDDVLAAGARRIGVVSAILQAPDVARACQRFKVRLASARGPNRKS